MVREVPPKHPRLLLANLQASQRTILSLMVGSVSLLLLVSLKPRNLKIVSFIGVQSARVGPLLMVLILTLGRRVQIKLLLPT